MFKIIEAHNIEPKPELGVESSLHFEIDIEGYHWSRGGFPVEWTKQDITYYVNDNYVHILSEATTKPSDITPRPDLVDASPDEIRATELLHMSPPVISQPEMWELVRIFGKKLGYKFEDT